MEGLLEALQALPAAEALRSARWSYALVSAGHLLGIALLVGAILPLNLRLLGFWSSVPLEAMARPLVVVSASGLFIAACFGLLLFSVRAPEYAALGVFQIKLALIFLGTGLALRFHWRYGFLVARAPSRARTFHGCLSLLCWLGALICGRLIAFAGV